MAKVRPAVVVSFLLLASRGVFAAGPEAVPLFDGLGGFSRKVTTGSPEAQRYFDQGLAFMYAFNHDEAIRAFRRAGELDPKCAMAFWGVAIANGPHINNPVVPDDRARAAWKALGEAKALAPGARPVEQSLILALAARYADPQPEDRKPLEQAYADAKRRTWAAYPKDADVGALFAESLADLRPWDLWRPDGQPQPGTQVMGFRKRHQQPVKFCLRDMAAAIFNPEDDAIFTVLGVDHNRAVFTNTADVILQYGPETVGKLLEVDIYRRQVITR